MRITEEPGNRPASPEGNSPSPTSVPSPLLPTTRGLHIHLSSLRALGSTAYQPERLQSIVNAAIASKDKEATFQSLSLHLREILQASTSATDSAGGGITSLPSST